MDIKWIFHGCSERRNDNAHQPVAKSGEYGNSTEVIRDAVRRLKAQEMRKAAWQHAIEAGDTDPGDDTAYTPNTADGTQKWPLPLLLVQP